MPEDYLAVVTTFGPAISIQAPGCGDTEDVQKSARLAADGDEAGQIVARAKTGVAAIESVKAETQRMGPFRRFTI